MATSPPVSPPAGSASAASRIRSAPRFGGYRLCARRHRLLDPDGHEPPIRAKSLEVLRFLAGHAGSVVTKEAILDAVWAGRCVTDDALHQCVRDIRRALGDDDRSILRTVPRRGYLLVADAALAEPADASSFGTDAAESPPRWRNTPWNHAISADGTRVAWTEIGAGIPLLKVPNWIADVEMALGNGAYPPFYGWLAERCRFVRFDQRGTGLSEREIERLDVDAIVDDVVAVADAAGIDRCVLYGASQGAAFGIAFADRCPERVLGMIFRGGIVVGPGASGDPRFARWLETASAVVRNGWDSGDHAYRRYFSSRIASDAPPEILRDLDEMQRLSITADMTIRNFAMLDRMDLRAAASRMSVPTLLLHAREDAMVPFTEGRRLARLMPHARFVAVEGVNHVLLPGSAGAVRAQREIDAFLAALGSEPS